MGLCFVVLSSATILLLLMGNAALLHCVLAVMWLSQSELLRPIAYNQTSDVHRGSALITRRWRHRTHANTITSVNAAKQTVTTFHNKQFFLN